MKRLGLPGSLTNTLTYYWQHQSCFILWDSATCDRRRTFQRPPPPSITPSWRGWDEKNEKKVGGSTNTK
eukprot:g27416.t1